MPYLQRQDLSYSLWWDGRNVCYTVGFGLRLLDDIVRETVSHITSSHPLYYLLVWVNRHKRTVNSQRPTQVWQPGLHWGAGTLHGKGQASGGAEAFAATMRRTHPMPKHKYTLYIYIWVMSRCSSGLECHGPGAWPRSLLVCALCVGVPPILPFDFNHFEDFGGVAWWSQGFATLDDNLDCPGSRSMDFRWQHPSLVGQGSFRLFSGSVHWSTPCTNGCQGVV